MQFNERREHEEGFVSAFVPKERRHRYGLLANPRKRAEILDRLNHCQDLDPRYATWLPPRADALALLRAAGSPEQVYVISDERTLDGQFLALEDALREVEASGWGSIISCIPGKLAYYRGEAREGRALLRKPDLVGPPARA